ncbi:sensor histidine kinase [Nocardioides halotolerans]|uniref:sensor histidine kinase n=1 Tax=Nocardioides halotolerans TaxID=433660 RepID=UPI00040F8872|nr:histidine kinase [Nocardioides halotolerans]
MREDCERPAAEAYQPRVSTWGHGWRLVAMLLISCAGWLPIVDDQAEWLWVVDVSLGVLSYVLVFFRRRWPVTIAVITNLCAAVSGTSSGPAVLALASVATRRRWREIALSGSAAFVGAMFFAVSQPGETDDPWWLDLSVTVIATAAILGWGMYIGSRRELIWTLKNRAERAESEQEQRVAQARANERARIAREMHDVLAHRISQVSMHAGALAFREDLTPEQVHASASVIREKAHEALTDLRGVLGVLRGPDGEPALAPQPTYADLGLLIAEARQGGLSVTVDDRVAAPDQVPEAVGRTVYRIVQEGITNARKHAPGSLLTVELTGSPDAGLDVVMRNPLGFGSATPGSGLGLVGLAERAELRGGRLEARREGATFVVHGWIPWAA